LARATCTYEYLSMQPMLFLHDFLIGRIQNTPKSSIFE
jgi:hypothetical protein